VGDWFSSFPDKLLTDTVKSVSHSQLVAEFTRDASRAEVLKQMSTLMEFEPLADSLHANLYHSP